MNRGIFTSKDVALLPVRAAIGSAMLYHGTQKAKSEGAAQVGPWFESLGISPGERWARATGIAETTAGLLFVLGVGTRIAALAVLVTQAVALLKVHGPKGFDNTKGGFEYNLSLMAIALALLAAGPGKLSAHEALEHSVEGRGWARAWRKRKQGLLISFIKLLK